MITKTHIEANSPFIVKWAKALTDANNQVTEGVLEAPSEEFITRIDEEAEFLSDLRFVEMDGKQADIQSLRARVDLQNMMKVSGASAGTQITNVSEVAETVPALMKTVLDAHFFTAYTWIPKSFLLSNIEKEAFIRKYESLMIPSCAFSADQIAIFGKVPSASQTSAGYEALNGILAQLDSVADYYDDHKATNPKLPMGKFTDITAYGDNVSLIDQIDAMLQQFTTQGGKRKLANIYVSSKMEALLIAEASKRQTERGDAYFFDDAGNLVLRGRTVKQLDALDNPVNSYGDVVLIANPDSIAYAPLLDVTSEGEYSVEHKAYLTSVDMAFDVGIIFSEDVLYSEVVYEDPTDGGD